MGEPLREFATVLLLILLNGFFAGMEMALISLRKTRVQKLLDEGHKKAKLIKKLQEDPESFLATIQVGITLVSTVASAFAGASMAEKIVPLLQQTNISWLDDNAYALSFGFVVLLVSYFSLVLGELVPKSLGLKYSEKFALFAVYPVYALSKIFYPFVKFLTFSSNIILKPFKDSTNFSENKLSEEEIRTLIYEGRKAGTIEKREHEILENVFEFSDMTVGKIMTTSKEVVAFDVDQPVDKTIEKVIESGYTRIPFYKDTFDNIIGILNVKDLLKKMSKGNQEINLRDLLSPPFFVPNSQKVSDVLHKFQKNKTHMAIVTDEHGEVDGLVTLEDILEELVGDIADEKDEAPDEITKFKDNWYIVKGGTSIIDFNRYFKSHLPEDSQFTTISGFILHQTGRFPESGDLVEFEDLQFKVREKSQRTVSSVLVRRKI